MFKDKDINQVIVCFVFSILHKRETLLKKNNK